MPLKNKFQASRYVHYFLLLSKEELLEFLPDGFFVVLGKMMEDPIITKEEVGKTEMPAIAFALSKDHFDFVNIPDRGVIAKEKLPVMEIRPFSFMITSDGKLLENTSGKGAIDFGLSFSYPTLFQKGEEIVSTKDHFEEAKLFRKMRDFIRKKTKPGNLLLNGEKLQSTFRIGRNATDIARQKISQVKGLQLL